MEVEHGSVLKIAVEKRYKILIFIRNSLVCLAVQNLKFSKNSCPE